MQEVTTTSWGRRIVGALCGVFLGFALIIGAFFLIFWNEGNGLHTAQSLEQARAILLSVPNAPIDSKNDLRVVYFSGLATTEDLLEDKLFGVSQKAIQLSRHVEMYQWQEKVESQTEKEVGGSEKEVKTYTYEQVWSPESIDSAHFKELEGHKNPSVMPLHSKVQYAKQVTVGDFNLPASLVKKISGNTSVDLSKVDTTTLKEKFHKSVHPQDEGLYLGSDPETPVVGDLRVTMSAVLPEIVSIIAQQRGNSLQPYMAPAGKTVSLIEMGQISAPQMVQDAQAENRLFTWIFRIVALVLMIIGLALIMGPLSVVADVLPFLGSLVGFGTGLIAFIGGLMLWTVGVALAWFTVRPLWSMGLIAATVAISYLLYSYKKNKLSTKLKQ